MITRFLLLEDCGHVSALLLLAISGDLVTVATTSHCGVFINNVAHVR